VRAHGLVASVVVCFRRLTLHDCTCSSVSTALRVFGFSKREMIGQNLSVLIPEPIASHHQEHMKRYIATGREVSGIRFIVVSSVCLPFVVLQLQTIVRTSRTMFARHRQGHIFPIILHVDAMDSSFVGVIQKIPTQDEFIWYYAQSHVIVAASELSLLALGVRVTWFRVTFPNYSPCFVLCAIMCPGSWKDRSLMDPL
jgi:hypothetical protein